MNPSSGTVKPWCCHCVDHRTIAQDGKVKRVTIERHELRRQLRDAVHKRYRVATLARRRKSRSVCALVPALTSLIEKTEFQQNENET